MGLFTRTKATTGRSRHALRVDRRPTSPATTCRSTRATRASASPPATRWVTDRFRGHVSRSSRAPPTSTPPPPANSSSDDHRGRQRHHGQTSSATRHLKTPDFFEHRRPPADHVRLDRGRARRPDGTSPRGPDRSTLLTQSSWFVFGGLWLALGYALAGVVFCILIVTIPLGRRVVPDGALRPVAVRPGRGAQGRRRRRCGGAQRRVDPPRRLVAGPRCTSPRRSRRRSRSSASRWPSRT